MAIIDLHKGKPPSEKRGKRWRADYYDASGKRRRKDFATKAEAVTYEADQLRKRSLGSDFDERAAQRILVADLWVQFIDRVRVMGVRGGSPASPKTITKYESCYKNYISPHWGTAPIGNVRYAEVSQWITSLQSVSGGPASEYLRRETSGIFRSLMDHAVRLEYLPKNPALDAVGRADYRPTAVKQKSHVYLTMAQLKILADCCPGYESLILTAGLCGLRFGELTALTVGDLSLGERPIALVNKAYTDNKGQLILKETKTGKDRSVPLPRLLGDMLTSETADRPPAALVWPAPKGGVIRHGSFTKVNSRFDKAKTAAATAAAVTGEPFPSLTFHDLRHTAVSLAIRAGVNVKVVQRIAGHAQATVTLDTYAGLFVDDLHDSAARLNDELLRHW